MRVLILEPHATGHHANYCRWLIAATIRKSWTAVLATSADALSHPALSSIASDFEGIEVYPLDVPMVSTGVSSTKIITREVSYWLTFRRAIMEMKKRQPVDCILVPYVDYCFHALACLGTPFGGIPWCGISMRLALTREQLRGRKPWKWRFARRVLASRSLRALFVINPSVADVPRDWYPARTRAKLRYLPDPALLDALPVRTDARRTLDVEADQLVILVFGAIDERKGIDSLVGAIELDPALSRYVIVLAGMQSQGVRHLLSLPLYANLRAQRRLIVLDRFVSDVELAQLLAAADVVWLGYRNHAYMSGVLVLAGKAAVPVLGTVQGEIGGYISKFTIGVAARIDQPSDVARGLLRLLDARLRSEMGQRARLVFSAHTIENFGDIVLSAVETTSRR